MIARSPSAVSKPCRPPPNSSPTRAMTAKPCATGWQNAKPRPSSHRARTARSNTIMTRPSTGSATSSSACLPPQGLAPYSHPLRPQHQKLHRRNRPCRRRHLVAVMSPDPSRANALRRSILDLMETADRPHYAHPMFWAPFIVVGAGGAAMGA